MEAVAPGTVPSAAGFPDDYPIMRANVNNVDVYLRPLVQPLYDTENFLTPTTAIQRAYFQRPLNNTTAAGGITKTIAETNMRNAGQLPTPQHHQILGFVFEVEPNVSVANWNQIYSRASFTFNFSGNRVYLEIPLLRIPAGVGITGFAATTVAATSLGGVQNGLGHVANLYRFTIGNKALQIRPNEAFNVLQDYAVAPTLTAFDFAGAAIASPPGIRMRVYLMGLFYQSL